MSGIPAFWRPYVVACASGQIDDAIQQRAATRLAKDGASRKRRIAKSRPSREAKAEKRIAVDLDYARARVEAFLRSTLGSTHGQQQCEVYDGRIRCGSDGEDPDHVLGGSSKRDMDRLGAEGLQVMCRTHHDLKTTNTPTGRYWLEQAKAHAVRTGARRLLPLVEKALAKYEAKHGPREEPRR